LILPPSEKVGAGL